MNQDAFLNNFYSQLEKETENFDYVNKLKELIQSDELNENSFESLIKEEF